MRTRAILTATPLIFLASLGAGQWTPQTVVELQRWLGAPALSPDGQVAFSVTQAVVGPDESEWRTHVWVTATAGGDAWQLTRGKDSCWAPAWSPDGRRMAFLSARGSERPNLWLIASDGGEAMRLTDVEGAISTFQWSPDGDEMAFLMRDPESEEEKEAAQAMVDPKVVDQRYHYRHLHRVAAVTDGRHLPAPVRVTSGRFHVVGFDWSPDGERFLLSHQPTPREGDWRNTDVSWVPATGGELRPLVRHPGMDKGAIYSPDGKTVAFVSDRGNRSWARDWRICLVPAAGGEVTVLPPTPDQLPGEFLEARLHGWTPDGRGIYFVELEGTSTHLFLAPAGGGPSRRVTETSGWKWDFTLSRDGSQIAFVQQDFGTPEEIRIRPVDGTARQVTAVNAALAELPVGSSEVIRWPSFDGLEIEGLLHFPLRYAEGRRYPLLVNLHGGPSWAFQRGFDPDLQVLAARSFLILQVNPRGSDGYGKAFRFANLRDWGGNDVKDVLAGVDHLIARGLVDPRRLGVFGGSYGGYLTAMVISRSARFQAAAVWFGATDLVSSAGTSSHPGMIPSFLESEFWEKPELWQDRSPIYHAGHITTPTLLVYGEEDPKALPIHGYELYRALQRRGVETELVVYPRSGHGIAEPKLAIDGQKRQLAWFTRHLLPTEAP